MRIYHARGMLSPMIVVVIACASVAYGAAPVPRPTGKIDLRIYYAGHPGSDREKEFVAFLGAHFRRVGTGDFLHFDPKQAEGYDVVILDWDEDLHWTKIPKLPKSYKRATVTIAEVGSEICSHLRLKTGYL